MGNPAEKPGNGFIYFPTYQISHEHFKLCHIISVKMKKKPQNLLLGGRKSYLREEEAVQKAAAFSRQKQFSFFFALRFLLPVPIISPHPPSARAAPLSPIRLRREVATALRRRCQARLWVRNPPSPRAPPPARLGLSRSGLTHAEPADPECRGHLHAAPRSPRAALIGGICAAA